jgi:carboxypeptidase C (cathepsin A)
MAYTATADYLTLWKDPEASPRVPKAKIFYVSYVRKGTNPSDRPIAFCFNGGPGCSAVWLDFGLGPRRLDLPKDGRDIPAPYHLTDNAETWLDQTDLVFVDPVPTGLSRPAEGVKASDFEGYQNDLDASAEFIRSYLVANGRSSSPKLLVGESYGSVRVAGLAAMLPDKDQIGINGVVLISQALNYENDYGDLMRLPTYAAAAWFHHKIASRYQSLSLDQVCSAAETFVRDEYAPAVFQGDLLPEVKAREIASKLSEFTGIDPADILRASLQVPDFTGKMLQTGTRHLGLYDSRYEYLTADNTMFANMPQNAMRGAWTDYLSNELNFHTQETYRLCTRLDWGSDHDFYNNFDVLNAGLARNPGLKVLIVGGRYDLVTPYYAAMFGLDHLHLDPVLRPNIKLALYPCGHSPYFDQPSRVLLKADFDQLISSIVHPPPT